MANFYFPRFADTRSALITSKTRYWTYEGCVNGTFSVYFTRIFIIFKSLENTFFSYSLDPRGLLRNNLARPARLPPKVTRCRTWIPQGFEFPVIHRVNPVRGYRGVIGRAKRRHKFCATFQGAFQAAAGLKRHRGAVSWGTTAILQTTLRRINSLPVFMDFWD